MTVHIYGDADYFEGLTSKPLRFARDLGAAGGVELAAALMGDDSLGSPVAMLLELPPDHQLPRHSHGTHRVEVVVRGSLCLADGRVLTPGDVWTSEPDEFYGPHTAGPEGVLTVEIFASGAGLAPTPDPALDDDAAAMTAEIGARTRSTQALGR